MDTLIRGHHVPVGQALRNAAAACGATVVAYWVLLVVLEAFRTAEWIPNIHSHDQALALVVVFASYAIGWRHELIGALLALVGTALFFAIGHAEAGISPPLAAAGLAVPGLLYLGAWLATDRRNLRNN